MYDGNGDGGRADGCDDDDDDDDDNNDDDVVTDIVDNTWSTMV